MNTTPGKNKDRHTEDEGLLERIASKVDPDGTVVSDDEIMDPGANIQDRPTDKNRGRPTPSVRNDS